MTDETIPEPEAVRAAYEKALADSEAEEQATTENLKIKGFEIRFVEAVFNADTSGIDVYQDNPDGMQLVKVWDLAKQQEKWPGRNENGILLATVMETYHNWGVNQMHFQTKELPGALRFRVVRKVH